MDPETHAALPTAYAAEFDRLGKDIKAFTVKAKRKLRWWSAICGAAAGALVATGIALIASTGDFQSYTTTLLVLANVLIFVYLFGNLFLYLPGYAQHRRKELRRDRMNADASAVAKEHQRSNAPKFDHESMTTRQAQHAWYGDHSDLNWRDRERAQSMGLDADTYVSNFLDRE